MVRATMEGERAVEVAGENVRPANVASGDGEDQCRGTADAVGSVRVAVRSGTFLATLDCPTTEQLLSEERLEKVMGDPVSQLYTGTPKALWSPIVRCANGR